MFTFVIMQFVLATTLVSAVTNNLWVADYGGKVTTTVLSEYNGTYFWNVTEAYDDCAPSPSWLTIDLNRGLMFCLNEGLHEGNPNPNGSISSFTILEDGELAPVKNATSIVGPVAGTIYGTATGQRGLVTANYLGSAVTTWLLEGSGHFTRNEDFVFTGKGSLPEQNAPHPHEAVLDPTENYILVPDLGLDLVHIFVWERKTLKLIELAPLKVTPGTGPRHIAFWNPLGVPCEGGCKTYMFLVGELAGDVTSFEMTYDDAYASHQSRGLSFRNVSSALTQPDNPMNAPAEIEITPDGRFMIVSNRDKADPVTLGGSNSSSLASFELNQDGTFGAPVITTSKVIGNGYPRHFSLNKYGNLVAVGLQNTNSAIVLPRNTTTGEINPEAVASLEFGGQTTFVSWAF